MNKKAGGDVKTVTFAVLAFIVILGGGLAISSNFIFSNAMERSATYDSISGNFTGEGSATVEYLKKIDASKREDYGVNEDDLTIYEKGKKWVSDRFEDSMLKKSFITVKALSEADDIITDVDNNEGVSSIFYLNEAEWIAWSLGLFVSLVVLFAVIYFFRGLQG
jgi:hypothetical protein